MTRRLAAALALGLAIAGTSPAPVDAQRLPPPELTITALHIDVPSDLWGVSFADADHGFAVGSYHSVFRTDDGGTTWARVPTPLPTREPRRYSTDDATDLTNGTFTAVSFVDPDYGVAVTQEGSILVTSDRGASWTLRPTPAPDTVAGDWPGNVRPPSWSFRGVSFLDRDHGYVVGDDGLILATADGGVTWSYQGRPQYGSLHDVEFVDEFHGQVVGITTGRPDEIRYTSLGTNDGETWQANLADEARGAVVGTNLRGVAVTVPMHAIAVGEGGRIFVTFDEGKTWRLNRNGTNELLYDVDFADRRRGIAVGGVNFQGDSRAIVLATNDGGERWTAFPKPEFGFFRSVTFASLSTAYAVGCTDRTITEFVDDGKTIDPFGSCDAAVVKIDFPELDSSINMPVPSGGSSLPFVLLGAAALIAGAGLVFARRR